MKTYKGIINKLEPSQIFVFGSNPEGRHGAGAAKLALDKFGAIYGVGRGLQGQSYGLVTKNLRAGFCEPKTGIIYPIAGIKSVSKDQIKNNIEELYKFAEKYSNYEFLIAYQADNSNLNGYSSLEMAELFKSIPIPNNIIFNEEFYKLIK